METSYERFELVRVRPGLRLLDSSWHQRAYEPPLGSALEPGLYIAHWPAHVALRRFDRHAGYLGPFADLERARAALDVLKDSLDACSAGAEPVLSGKGHTFDNAWTPTPPWAPPAGLMQGPGPAAAVAEASGDDAASGIERDGREDLELVAEWAMC